MHSVSTHCYEDECFENRVKDWYDILRLTNLKEKINDFRYLGPIHISLIEDDY